MKEIKLLSNETQGFTNEQIQVLFMNYLKSSKEYWRFCQREGLGKGYCNNSYAKDKYSKELNLVTNSKDEQEFILKQYANIREAIKEQRLVINWCGGLSFNVHYITDNKLVGIGLIFKKSLCGYRFNWKEGNHVINCYGTSRTLEIIEHYAHNLGLKEFEQAQQTI